MSTEGGGMAPVRHNFLVPTKSIHHPVDVMCELRDRVEALPEFKATIRVPALWRDEDSTMHRAVSNGMMYLLGSWQSPFYDNQPSYAQWVNPAHPHTARYSDVIQRCECGAVVASLRPGNVARELPHDGPRNHAHDCALPDRRHARAELRERRREAITQSLRHGSDLNALDDRVGLPGTNMHSVVEGLGLDPRALKNHFLECRANTIVRLLEERPRPMVGRCYDISPARVSQIVERRTDTTADELRVAREEGEA